MRGTGGQKEGTVWVTGEQRGESEWVNLEQEEGSKRANEYD
jgi:hypothetical protein